MYDYISSLPAYQNTPTETRELCRQKVLTAINKLGSCNDREISEFLGWAINRVTNRRGELITQGLIELHKKAVDPMTNRTVSYWKVIYAQRNFSQQKMF